MTAASHGTENKHPMGAAATIPGENRHADCSLANGSCQGVRGKKKEEQRNQCTVSANTPGPDTAEGKLSCQEETKALSEGRIRGPSIIRMKCNREVSLEDHTAGARTVVSQRMTPKDVLMVTLVPGVRGCDIASE